MFRAAGLGMALAVLLAAAPARAATLPVTGLRHSEQAPARELALTAAQTLDAHFRADDPDAVLEAQRALLERSWGAPVAGLRDQTRSATEAAATLRIPIGSSDVNGDGRGDVVFFEVDYNAFNVAERKGVTALDGRTGDLLWSRDYGDAYDLQVLSPGDVTGDGAADLIIVDVERTITRGPIPSGVGPYRTTVDWAWELALVDGPQGTDRWTRRIDGEVVYSGSRVGGPPMGVEAAELEATNGLFELRRSGDDDGDGLPDFLLTRYDFSSALLFGQLVRGAHTLLAAHAEAVDAGTGAIIHSRDSDRRPGGATLRSVRDATGDGRDDLLWAQPLELTSPTVCVPQPCKTVRRSGLELALIDGATRDAAWTHEIQDPDVVRAAPVTTRAGDPLIAQDLADGRTELFALAGGDGRERWRVETQLSDVPTVVGDDLLLWEGTEPADLEFRLRLRRIDGATGDDLLVTQHDLPGTDDDLDILIAQAVGDVDADGAPDVMVAEWHHTPPWIETGTARTLLKVESGRTGLTLFTAERDRKALLFAGGDLLPSGPDDLLEGSTTYNDLGFLRFSAIAMPDGRTMWSRDDVLTYATFGAARDVATGTDDVIYGRTRFNGETPHPLSRIDMLVGASGVPRWGHGDSMGDPPIEPSPTPTPTPPPPDPNPETETETETGATRSPDPPPPARSEPAPAAAPFTFVGRPWITATRRAGRRLRVRLACAGTCRGRVVARVRVGKRRLSVRTATLTLRRRANVVVWLPAGARAVRVRVAA